MTIGVFTVLFQQLPLEDTLDIVRRAGVEAVEIGTGGYPGNAHCKPDELLADEARLIAFRDAVVSRGLFISALSCHATECGNNTVDPEAIAGQAFRHGVTGGRDRVEAVRRRG